MATHSQNIQNLENAVYGEQVRRSMIELFEEDYTLVNKGISLGTDITSGADSTTGYSDGNVYINTDTLDVWKLTGTAWQKAGNLKGIADITVVDSSADDGLNKVTITLTNGTSKTFNIKNGSKGSKGDTGNGISSITTVESTADAGNNSVTIAMTDGTSQSFNVKNGSKGSTGDAAGFGTPTASVDRNTGTPSVTVTASGPDTAKVFNFDFKNIKGETGDKGDTGRSLTSITSIDSGKNHTLTATYSDGISNVITTLKDGNDGSGVGDMVKATYDTNDNGIVDKSEALFDSATGTTIPATTVLNKADKATSLSGYGISDAYTKTQVNSKLDDKVNEPSTEGTAGQALVTDGNGGRSWGNPNYVKDIDDDEFDVSDDGKLSLDTKIRNKLSNFDTNGNVDYSNNKPLGNTIKNVVGDVWVLNGTYSKGDCVIDNNKVYELVGNGGGATIPSTDSGSAWKETSLSALNSKLTNKLNSNVVFNGMVRSTTPLNNINLEDSGMYLIFACRSGMGINSVWIASYWEAIVTQIVGNTNKIIITKEANSGKLNITSTETSGTPIGIIRLGTMN